ncbi:MAG: transposase [Saprospiraceae bacterium]|nr:transposase [Saprospiraceae bacterium]MCF8251984.1 transposase [Saprospiraceae bacterium]MCF8281681.1 transposase [Bacteroidales bacterium]MCF8313669.1 transposase [Saprospiraceae bacterium]MCF8442376.1 transposase [Saprospiraceae bacterium]
MKKQQQQQTNASGNRLRRKYDREFKQEALRMLKNGKGAKEVSEQLGISEQVLYNWKSKETGLSASESTLELKIAREETEQLRKGLKEAEMERDILKKALNIFSRTTS